MKVQAHHKVQEFNSFKIDFIVESEEEAKALYAIFNYCPNLDILPEGAGRSIRGIIGKKYSDLGPDQMIARGVDYLNFYRSKVQE